MSDLPIAIVISRFAAKAGNALQNLESSCTKRLDELGQPYQIFRVPGAFEIPTLAKRALLSQKFSAVIALGVVVRGETIHFELVAQNCARSLAELGVTFAQPVIFGVLATETTAQAETRATLGRDFAEAAVEMVGALAKID